MTQGFKATLFAGVIALGAVAPVFAAAPVIGDIPDVSIGDLDGSTANEFVFNNAFDLNDYVTYDGDKADLLWSFAEGDGGLGANQYTINGVQAAVSGTAAIAAEETGHPNTLNPANPINASTSVATFRDIILSPTSSSGPYDDPSTADAATAAAGKAIRYYVSDGENVDSADAIIRSVDNSNSTLTPSDDWSSDLTDTTFNGWVPSGLESAGVSIAKTANGLTMTAVPRTGETRFLGYQNENLLNYNDVGAGRIVRGKFYISTTNPMLDFNVNKVPTFRLRLTNTTAIDAAVHYEYAQTGIAAPAHEPRYALADNQNSEIAAGMWIRPGDMADTPSLYTVDFDPIDVPAAANTPIGALMETYSYHDPANGTLTLHEVVLGTYNSLQDNDPRAVKLFDYNRTAGLNAGVGGAKEMTGGPFNQEAVLKAGYRQKLSLPYAAGPYPADDGPYASNTDFNADGLVATTDAVPQDRFGFDLINVVSKNNADKPRVEPGKLYKAKFFVTAGVKTSSTNQSEEIQGNLRFRMQTAAGTVSYLLELASTGIDLGTKGNALAAQALPGNGTQNPLKDSSLAYTGEDGGWYNVIGASLLDTDRIRKDYKALAIESVNNEFVFFGLQPGPGNSDASARDITLGIDLIQSPGTLDVGTGTPVTFSRPTQSTVRIGAVELYAYPSIDDGGYDFGGPSL